MGRHPRSVGGLIRQPAAAAAAEVEAHFAVAGGTTTGFLEDRGAGLNVEGINPVFAAECRTGARGGRDGDRRERSDQFPGPLK